MRNYVKLYEEFNPSEAKSKLAIRLTKVKGRMDHRKAKIDSASKRGDQTSAAIHKTKMDIDKLDVEKIKLKNSVIDLRVKRDKEREAKKKKS